VKARYSKHYKITDEELQWLAARVEILQMLIGEVGTERLGSLQRRSSEDEIGSI